MFAFQLNGVAETGFEPETFAFQLLVTASPAYCQLTSQPLMGVVPLLVMRTAPVKPLFHSLLMMYSHCAAKLCAEKSKLEAITPDPVNQRAVRVL